MDWKTVLEISITTVATGITTFVLSVLKRHKNKQIEAENKYKDNQLKTEIRLTELETYQNANFDTMKEIKKDLDFIREYIMEGNRKNAR